MKTNKEVQVKPAAQLPSVDLSEWGSDQVLGQDIVIAKILPMQPSSVLVTDGKATMGEFRDSLSGVKLGSIVEPIDIIPFHIEKFWDILVQEGDQFKWDHSDPLIENPALPGYNDNLPWSDKVDGVEIKRVRRMNFYVLLPKEVAANTAIPYIVSFKSTSFREGKKVFTQMFLRNRKANLPPPAYTFKLGGLKQKNEKGTFIVPTVEMGRASTEMEVAESLNWYRLIKKGAVKVDDSDLKGAADVHADVDDTGAGAF